MTTSKLSAATVAAMLFVAPCLVASPAMAAPTADAMKSAKQEFAEGQKAFKDGDFRHAAESFEAAYRDVPHPASLWNAARAWHRADEKTKAANLYAKYLRVAPPNARDRNSATEAMKELSGQLAKLEIHAGDMTDVKVDDQAVEDLSVFVTPGTHVVQATYEGRPVRKEQTVTAGSTVSVALVAPPPDNKPPPTGDEKPPPPDTATPEKSGGLPPTVIVIGGVLTGVGVGLTMWSGLDTVSAKKSFDNSPSQAGLDSGVGKQTRTNVLLGATIGVGALTIVTAVFFTNWGKKSDKTKVGLGPGTLSIQRAF